MIRIKNLCKSFDGFTAVNDLSFDVNPGEVLGLVTGPLTNLALAVKLEPELPRLLHRLVVMGGAFNHPGNTTPSSDCNHYHICNSQSKCQSSFWARHNL